MIDPKQLEEAYQMFSEDLSKWVPEGIIDVDLFLLKQLNLLNVDDEEEKSLQSQFPFYFHVLETDDKVTLFNNQFAVWIVPEVINNIPTTLTLISLVNGDGKPNLEMIFSTSGVYNTPRCVLRVLRHYLSEVIDTEATIESIGRAEGV